MVRQVGFNTDEKPKPSGETPERTYQATAAEHPKRPGIGLFVFALVVLFMVGMGLAVLLISLQRGRLEGIVFGMMFTVATASIGVSSFIKRFRGEREARRNSDWRRDTRDRDAP